MEATVSYLLMLRKYINSQQNIRNNILKYFKINNIKKKKKKKKKTELKGNVNFFSLDSSLFDTNDILDIHKCLMKGT